jgi:hypothetical protein
MPFARSIWARLMERRLQLVDLHLELGGLLVAPQRDLDRALHDLGRAGFDPGRDPAFGRASDEVDVAVARLRDHRPRRVLDGLRDQRERVVVVLVHDDDREIRVLGGDPLEGLRHRHGIRRDLVAEPFED